MFVKSIQLFPELEAKSCSSKTTEEMPRTNTQSSACHIAREYSVKNSANVNRLICTTGIIDTLNCIWLHHVLRFLTARFSDTIYHDRLLAIAPVKCQSPPEQLFCMESHIINQNKNLLV